MISFKIEITVFLISPVASTKSPLEVEISPVASTKSPLEVEVSPVASTKSLVKVKIPPLVYKVNHSGINFKFRSLYANTT